MPLFAASALPSDKNPQVTTACRTFARRSERSAAI